MKLVTGILIGLLTLVAQPMVASAGDPVLRITQAEFLFSDAAEPPLDSVPWQPQTLPDNWVLSRPGTHGYSWYRLRFDLPRQPDQPYGVYIRWFRLVGAVYANGTYVGRTGPFDAPETGARPQFFVIPTNALRAGRNTLHLRLFVNETVRGAVSVVTLGEEAEVLSEYEHGFFQKITAAQINCVVSALLGVFMILLWLRRRHESLYGYFGLAALSWAAVVAKQFVRVPIDEHYWFAFSDSAYCWNAVLLLFFAMRYGGWRWPRIEALIWTWAVAATGMISWEEFHGGEWLQELWGYTAFLIEFAFVAVVAVVAWRRRTVESTLLALALASFYVMTLYDGFVWAQSLEALELGSYTFSPLYLVIGWILVDRFVRSLNESEKLNAELEQRVAQKHAELDQNYQRMQQMERQAAVVEERQRIMSDMHDGIGGQLISTLSLVDQKQVSYEEIAAALRECVDDLRLTIDSLEPTENDLLPVLGNLRYRLDGRLKKQGIDLDWQVKDVPKLACLNPKNVLHILRILQEAFTNVLKHTHASMISVETGVDVLGKHVFIRVSDNGSGFAGEHKGHGLDNMRRRAQIVGGELDIRSSPTGTTLNLLLPVS